MIWRSRGTETLPRRAELLLVMLMWDRERPWHSSSSGTSGNTFVIVSAGNGQDASSEVVMAWENLCSCGATSSSSIVEIPPRG